MNSTGLYYFVETAKDLNITQTAKRLFISQQALSDQIKKLEKHYDAVFFERKPRLKLTYQGEQMLSFAKQVVQAEHKLTETLRSEAHGKRAKIRVALAGTRVGLLPEILNRYLDVYPNVIPTICTGSSEQMIARLQLERMDVYFGSFYQTHGDYVSEAITGDELFFLIRHELLRSVLGSEAGVFIQSHRRGVRLAETARFPTTLAPVTAAARTYMDIAFQTAGTVPDVMIETESNDAMFDICAGGLCSGFIMREIVYNHIRNNTFPSDLLCFPITDLRLLHNCGVAYPRGLGPGHIADFVECCKNVLLFAQQTVERYVENQFESLCADLD